VRLRGATLWPALGIAVFAVLPLVVTDYFTSAILTRALFLGMAAASLILLAGYGGMVSLAQTALYGVAAYTFADLVSKHGWTPWAGIAGGLAVAVGVGVVFGAVASRSTGIYFLMITFSFAVIAFYFFLQVPEFGSHEGINDVAAPRVVGDAYGHHDRLYYAALLVAVAIYVGLRYLVRTPFGLALQGVRDDPVRMRALGFNVALHRTLGFAVAALVAGIGGVFSVFYETRISPGTIDLTRTIELLTIAVIGGLYRLEGAWIGALVFVVLENYTRGTTERFDTWIGALFLVIVLLSPGGIVGVLESLRRRIRAPRVTRESAGPTQARVKGAGAK
jgi:branched-chain amino acid transport system permease protein